MKASQTIKKYLPDINVVSCTLICLICCRYSVSGSCPLNSHGWSEYDRECLTHKGTNRSPSSLHDDTHDHFLNNLNHHLFKFSLSLFFQAICLIEESLYITNGPCGYRSPKGLSSANYILSTQRTQQLSLSFSVCVSFYI